VGYEASKDCFYKNPGARKGDSKSKIMRGVNSLIRAAQCGAKAAKIRKNYAGPSGSLNFWRSGPKA
jgi:hypothetical protein